MGDVFLPGRCEGWRGRLAGEDSGVAYYPPLGLAWLNAQGPCAWRSDLDSRPATARAALSPPFQSNIINRYPQLRTCIHSNTHFRENKLPLISTEGLLPFITIQLFAQTPIPIQ
jgi:hypothetical protein